MAIVGLGTDIAEIERIEHALARTGIGFAKRILTDDELVAFEQHKQPGRYLAKRFAAKEAASKALGTGIGRGISFHHFAISHDVLGKPLLTLSGKAGELAQTMGVQRIHLSISDERHYSVATVILES